jgi:hypothetical protein
MKLFGKLTIAILFIAALLPFTILKDDDGDTLMSFSDLNLSAISIPKFSLPDLPEFFASKKITPASDDDLSGKDIFYKWYDSEGNIQFTSEPPPDGIEYTLKGFDPNANVIQAVKLSPSKTKTDESTPTEVKAPGPENGANPYVGDSIKKLFEETENIEKLLHQRLKDQNPALNQ